ncbi:class I SAM-dependent methyltransferase [Roseobacter sp.]|uniref:class I SAM-dependent methyltransferase n=1 Tax=Roseobacter sp. TaxID=1907202 RepID=UPI00385A350A
MTATDLAAGMIEIANEKLKDEGSKNVAFKVADVLDHPLETERYDAVLAHNLLHLVSDLDRALDVISSLVKPGGVFISKTVCAPEHGGFKYAMLSRVAIPVMQAIGKAPFVDFMTTRVLETKILGSGFKIVETAGQIGMLPSRYIVARKV